MVGVSGIWEVCCQVGSFFLRPPILFVLSSQLAMKDMLVSPFVSPQFLFKIIVPGGVIEKLTLVEFLNFTCSTGIKSSLNTIEFEIEAF